MTNTAKLQGVMREKGHTLLSLANEVGLSGTGLFNKIHNISEFSASEIKAISVALDLTKDDAYAIFFA